VDDSSGLPNYQSSTFMDQKTLALEVRDLYAQLNVKRGEKPWDYRERTEGFVTDVGDLMKLVMAKSKLRGVQGDLNSLIAHELADCLWATIVIADELDVDLDKVCRETMAELKAGIQTKLQV